MENLKQHYYSIDLIRVVCSFMVVAIHNHPFEDYNPNLGYVFTQIVPRIAVPFFFAVSGYFLAQSFINESSHAVKYFKRILLAYTSWSLLYFIYQFIILKQGGSSISIFKTIVINYFFWGSWYQLWYFPALLFCVLISSLFNRFNGLKLLAMLSIVAYIIGVLGCSYYYIGMHIPVLNRLYALSLFNLLRRVVFMGLPFFMLGYFVNINFNKLANLISKHNNLIFPILIICFLFEICVVIIFRLQSNIIITFFLYPLTAWILMMCINNPLHRIKHYAPFFNFTANLTFYIHPLVMDFLDFISKSINIKILQTGMFFATCFLCTVFSFFLYKLNVKWINKLVY